jgi:sortase A
VVSDDGGGTESPADPSDSATSADQALRNLERLPASEPERVSRWDRPPPPHDWRWVVSGIGKVLIVLGLLMFAFVAYQLWGTGIEYAQAQNRLDDEFEELLAGTTTTAPTPTSVTVPETTTTTTVAGRSNRTTTTTAPPATVPPFDPGDAIARIEIPSIGVDAVVVAGVEPDDLKKGPGHYEGTPMPGQLGNSAIAGHRTTYGQPFYRLDEVAAGDEIVLTTVQGRFVYRATGSEVVEPEQSDVVATTDPTVATLTLTTCTPRYTASQRLVVHADLDLDVSDAPQEAVLDYGGRADDEPAPTTAPATTTATPDTASSTPPTTDAAPPTTVEDPTVAIGGGVASAGLSEASADAFAHGWFSDGGAWPQVITWGLVGAAIAVGAYLLARSVRRVWVGLLVGVVPFVVALYFFFQNVNRLMPAAI